MVKRYSDLNQTKVETKTSINANLGRVDATPVTNFLNTVSKTADTFRNIAARKAETRALNQAKEVASATEIELMDGTPIYNPVLDGGDVYNQQYEKIYNNAYLKSLQSSFDTKISTVLSNHLENPESQFDAKPLLENMRDVQNNMLSNAPQKFLNDFSFYTTSQINSIFDRENQQVATKLNNDARLSYKKTLTELTELYLVDSSKENKQALENLKEGAIVFGPEMSQSYIKEIDDTIRIGPKQKNLMLQIFEVEKKDDKIVFANSTAKLLELTGLLDGRLPSVQLNLNGQNIDLTQEDLDDYFPTKAQQNNFRETVDRAIQKRNTVGSNTLELKNALGTEILRVKDLIAENKNDLGKLGDLKKDFSDFVDGVDTGQVSDAKAEQEKLQAKNEINREINTIRSSLLKQQYELLEGADRNIFLQNFLFNPEKNLDEVINELNKLKTNHPQTIFRNLDKDKIASARMLINNINIEELTDEELDQNIKILERGIYKESDAKFTLSKDSTMSSEDLTELGELREVVERYLKEFRQGGGSNKSSRNANTQTSTIYNNIKNNIPTSATQKETDVVYNAIVKDETNETINNKAELDRYLQNRNSIQNPIFMGQIGNTFKNIHNLDQLPSSLKTIFIGAENKNLDFLIEVSVPYLELLQKNNNNLYNQLLRNSESVQFIQKVANLPAVKGDDGNYDDNTTTMFNTYKGLYTNEDTRTEFNRIIINKLDKRNKETPTDNQTEESIAKFMIKSFKNEELDYIRRNRTDLLNKIHAKLLLEIAEDTSISKNDLEKIVKSTVQENYDNTVPFKESMTIQNYEKNSVINNVLNIPTVEKETSIWSNNIGIIQQKLATDIINKNVEITDTQPDAYNLLEQRPKLHKGIFAGEKGKQLYYEDFNTSLNQKHNLYPSFNNTKLATYADILTPFITVNGEKKRQAIILGRNAKLNITNDTVNTEGEREITAHVNLYHTFEDGSKMVDVLMLPNGDPYEITLNLSDLSSENSKINDIHRENQITKLNISNLINDVNEDKSLREEAKEPIIKSLQFKEFNNNNIFVGDIKNAENYLAYHRANLYLSDPDSSGYTETVKGTIITVNVPKQNIDINDELKETTTEQLHVLLPTKVYKNGVLVDVKEKDYLKHLNKIGLENLISDTNMFKVVNAEKKLKNIINNDNKVHQSNINKKGNLPIFTDKKFGRQVTEDAINEVLDITDTALPTTKASRNANYLWMLGTANAESEYGKHKLTFKDDKISRGIWQFDKQRIEKGKLVTPIFADLQQNKIRSSRIFKKNVEKVEAEVNKRYPDLKFKFSKLKHKDLSVPFYGALVVRLWLLTQPTTPADIDGASNLWKNRFNTIAGEGTAAGWKALNRELYNPAPTGMEGTGS